MFIFKIAIANHPHFPNPVFLEISNCDKIELTNLLKQYMYSWLWIKPDEINEAENITELFYQKHETFPLKLAGYFWEVQETNKEELSELGFLPQTELEESQITDSNTVENLENKSNSKFKKK